MNCHEIDIIFACFSMTLLNKEGGAFFESEYAWND